MSTSAVVASLTEGSVNPFSCISLSPSREYAVAAAKDTLNMIRIDPRGLQSLRKLKISQHFQTSVTNEHRSQVGKMYGDVRDTFKLGVKQAPRNTIHGSATVTAVEWSPPQIRNNNNNGKGDSGTTGEETNNYNNSNRTTTQYCSDSLVAVAASNGVICIWNAKQTFFSDGTGESSTLQNQQPEAILGQEHTRAVNSLAWHPKRPGILLSASQDTTVKLWERMEVTPNNNNNNNNKGGKNKEYQGGDSRKRFGFFNMTHNESRRDYKWFCKKTFEIRREGVREIQWSKFQDDVFALVTGNGSLVVYSMHIAWKAIVKIDAHAGEATSLDWHPTRPYIIATGGAEDRCVKVWDVESSVNMKPDGNVMDSDNTWNTTRSEISTGSTDTDKSSPSTASALGSLQALMNMNSSNQRTLSGGQSSARHLKSTTNMEHVIAIGSSVTKVRWRPPAFPRHGDPSDSKEADRHDAMFAVATAGLASAGGSGVISLWSTRRPYMPLSVVEGHLEGGVAGFVWIKTPGQVTETVFEISKESPSSTKVTSDPRKQRKAPPPLTRGEATNLRAGGRGDVESVMVKLGDDEAEDDSTGAIWQHVLSVGRDGKFILQSFVRGDRPISRVPSSCFAMANLSPFQRGYGSLQVFAVHQEVPNFLGGDFELTGLRQDATTAKAPGVFKEAPVDSKNSSATGNKATPAGGRRLPERTPELHFNVLDQGPLDENGLPLAEQNEDVLCVAPEVVHLSRFASSYKLHPDSECPTRVDLCLYNGDVAHDLKCDALARMWRSIAEMLNGSGLDELPSRGSSIIPKNVMHFAIIPTLKSLLLERADAGDVQTCVTLCEVLQIIEPENTTRIAGLELSLVREWYLSYIDLLQQMCLFTSATYLIKYCSDPFIAALNQQSTTIHESCPRCGKAIGEPTGSAPPTNRACQNCRMRVANCFVCHEPVKGMYVWCPGCGHGGHLEHALQWFGGPSDKTTREVCPTGCGHRCSLIRSSVSAFPRTDSLRCLPVAFDSSSNDGAENKSSDP